MLQRCRHSSADLAAPTTCCLEFESQAHHLCFYKTCYTPLLKKILRRIFEEKFKWSHLNDQANLPITSVGSDLAFQRQKLRPSAFR